MMSLLSWPMLGTVLTLRSPCTRAQSRLSQATCSPAASALLSLASVDPRCCALPPADVPVGGEDQSTVLQLVGEKRDLGFEPKDHLQLGEELDLIDFETAGTVSVHG